MNENKRDGGFDSDQGKLWVSVERTINLGNYQNKKYTVGVSIPTNYTVEDKEDIESNLAELVDMVESVVNNQAKPINSKYKVKE